MIKIIWKIGLVFIIAIIVTETSFILLAEAQGQYEENIPVYRALFISPWWNGAIPGSVAEEEFAIVEEALINNGWNQSNIRKLYYGADGDVTWKMINDSIIEIGENDTEYDTTIIAICSHGGTNSFDLNNYSGSVSYDNLNESLSNNLDSTLGLIINTCGSAASIKYLIADGRVIFTSPTSDDYLQLIGNGFDSIADYCIGDDPDNPIGDRNGAVSMKEVYNYSWKTPSYQFWSGYPINTTDQYYPLQITFQNFTDGKIDQITSKRKDAPSYKKILKDNMTGCDWRVAQEFQPSMENISKVRICLKAESINSAIRVSIQGVEANGTPNGTDLVYADVPRSEIPDYKGHVSFNFPDDYPLDMEKKYFIVIRTIQSDQGKYYIYCYNDDCYPVTPDYNYSCWCYDSGTWTENSECDIQFVTYGKNSNMPPHTPLRPSGGPKEGCVYVSYNFNVTTTDIDDDKIEYGFHWDGDDVIWDNNIGNYYDSGEIVKVNHTWKTSGQKFINVTARDTHGNQGGWSDVWYVNISPNEPPNPPTIDGPTIVGRGPHDYKLNSTDPDEDNISYFIDWDFPSQTEWTEFYGSGEEVTVTHTFPIQGRTYDIKVKAKDTCGAESNWTKLKVKKNCNVFGYTSSGEHSQNIKNKIAGTRFTMTANGIADNITAYVQTNTGMSTKTKCMIYEDSELKGTTEEKILETSEDGAWVTYNFSESKPKLSMNAEYILVCWSNDTCNISYDNLITDPGRFKNQTYGASLENITWDDNELRNYSIYCRYTTKPEITNVSSTTSIIGFGYNITISADIDDNGCGIDNVTVNITYPNNTSGNFTMNNTGNNIYECIFSDTWFVGEYGFTIWAVDNSWSTNYSLEYSFNVSTQADISACTIKDSYGNNEIVNLTDPPSSSYLVGYELIDNGDVLHIWNNLDHYYFNTSSGIQLTNHYDEYWSHNVLMLGYYNNDQWNLIYRTDELSGFNKDIESDNETYVNVTLWKNLNYAGYDFRLAIIYHLGIDDNELTVIPYIKNIDNVDIPYNLGFAWEIKDIQIDMTEENDYIDIDGKIYYLNDTGLDETYTNLDIPSFYIKENTDVDEFKSLYLRWSENLNYKVQVKSRDGQYNAPVTLAIKIGTLSVGQEKSTELFWHDASEVIYYFNDYDTMLAWATNPAYMVDGNTSNYASTTVDRDVEVLNINLDSAADKGAISKVEIHAFGKYSGSGAPPIHDILLKVLGGLHIFSPTITGNWSSWYDITNNPSAPNPWTWIDINNLIVEVEASVQPAYTLYCSKVDVRVTYNPNPVISNPHPPSGSKGITIAPVLSITISDPERETMNITWLSNSSGSWHPFEANSSVGNGTYHQTFSNASVNGQWWYWKVNVSDGINTVTSNVFSFYTGCQSKIENTGSTNFTGYLLMQIEYYNTTNSTWILEQVVVNESTPRAINAGSTLALDTIFNPYNVSTSSFTNGDGTYRVFAAFRNPDGNVLVCDDESLLEDSYQFILS